MTSGGRSKSILLIEDDKELCSLISVFFARHDFVVEAAHDGHAGLVRALAGGFDLVILDAMLPLLDGFELLRQLRKQSAIPVIMLTARTTEKDRIAGLNVGADDYLPKPFGAEELLARIRAVLRRTGGGKQKKSSRGLRGLRGLRGFWNEKLCFLLLNPRNPRNPRRISFPLRTAISD